MFTRYTFGTTHYDDFPPEVEPATTSTNPVIQRLRDELETGFKRDAGQFTTQAKASLVHTIWTALFDVESDTTQIFDTDDPQASPGMRCPHLEHALVVDEDNRRQPWSLSQNQKRGEKVRSARGSSWRKVPEGRMCGKILRRGQRYYTCK